MQTLPLALILCSSAVLAADVNDVIGLVETASITSFPSTRAVEASGSTTQKFNEVGKVKVNGKEYTVRIDASVSANGNLDFKSFENFEADGSVSSNGKIVIDGLGSIAYFIGADGRIQYAKNVLQAEGAIDIVANEGSNKLRLAANGALVCNSEKLTCDKIVGSYDISILSQWLNYQGAGNLNGVAGIANGNLVYKGTVTSGDGSWQYVNKQLVWVPSDKTATATTTKKPTSTPSNDATTFGASALAAVAGVAALIF